MGRVLLLILACAAPILAAELVAIANRDGKASLDTDSATNLLLGRTVAWPDGHHLNLIISAGSSGEAAVEAMTGRDVSRLMRGWKRLVFSGAAVMPMLAANDQEALALVARTPDAVVLLRIPPPVEPPAGTMLVPVGKLDAH